MVNFHLLTKISGYDSDFRRQIVEMIRIRFERVDTDLRDLIEDDRWSAVFHLLGEYFLEIEPYTQPSHHNGLTEGLHQIKEIEEDAIRKQRAVQLLESIAFGLEEARRAVVSGSSRTAVRAGA
jgi:hypothetical protein